MLGKSVLASTVIDRIQHSLEGSVVYFYCKSTDDHQHGMLTVAKSFLSQMVTDDLLPYLYQKWEENNKEVTLQNEKLAQELLELCLKAVDRRYIIIDGLDEFETRESRAEICKWFQTYVKDLPDQGAVRCLFVSQEDTTACKDLGELEFIKITEKDNKNDIRKFCKHWHTRIWTKFRLTPENVISDGKYDITKKVSERAKGR